MNERARDAARGALAATLITGIDMRVSDIASSAPTELNTPLQARVYELLNTLAIPFERVDTEEVVTMDDCESINQKLDMQMVKTLFLCNAQRTRFYLFVTRGDKAFRSKEFSRAIDSSRVSFAPADLMETMLGVTVGAATVFAKLMDHQNAVQVVLDADVVADEWYGCSDGTTTSYLKIRTNQIVDVFLPHIGHQPMIVRL